MASMGGGPHLDPEPLIRLVRGQGMLNKFLAAICKQEGLPSGGVKADLQNRIIEHIRRHALRGEVARYQRLKDMLTNPAGIMQNPSPARAAVYSASPAAVSPRYFGGGNAAPATPGGGYGQPTYRPGSMVDFKSSPFYTIQQQLGETKNCDTMPGHRHTVEIKIQAQDYPILNNLSTDKSYRVMVFCAGDAGHLRQDISFPHQSEIKVNSGEVKANLRGLKNKPGSTRPVDITEHLRLRPSSYPNKVEMTYALTTKAGGGFQKFYLVINVVKMVAVEELLKEIKAGKKIPKDIVVSEMVAKSKDTDIVTTSTVLSLKCPLSTLRIDVPCRSISCRHNQCFDATSYLQLQEQGPTWLCPICNNPAPFDSLAVDEYVKEILAKTSKSVDQVTIEPDGKWSTNFRAASPSNGVNNAYGSDGDDDIIEIKDSSSLAARTQSTPMTTASTPQALISREASAALAPPRSVSHKRPISAVIDLTLSDDDDEPVRPPKRQSIAGFGTPIAPPVYTGANQNGQGSQNRQDHLNGYSNGYH